MATIEKYQRDPSTGAFVRMRDGDKELSSASGENNRRYVVRWREPGGWMQLTCSGALYQQRHEMPDAASCAAEGMANRINATKPEALRATSLIHVNERIRAA